MTWRSSIGRASSEGTFCVLELTGVKQDNRIEAMLPENDPQLKIHHEMRDRFGSDEMTLIAWQTDRLFSNEEIRKIRDLTERLGDLDEVEWISSLTNCSTVTGDLDTIDIAHLIDNTVDTFSPDQLESIRDQALADPILIGTLIGKNGDATSITMGLRVSDDPEMRVKLMKGIHEVLADFGGREKFWLAGAAPIHAAYVESISHDGMIFFPAVLLLISLMLLFIFRSFAGVAVPFTAMAAVAVLTMGAYVWAGKTVNVVTTMLPPLIMLMTTSAVVHIISHTRQHPGVAARKAVLVGTAAVGAPIFLNCLTSGIGFSSLAVSEIVPVRNFGIFAAVGLGMVFLFCMTAVPILLAFRPVPPLVGEGRRDPWGDKLIKRFVTGCELLTTRFRWRILILSAMVLAVAGYGISRIEVQTNLMDYFDPQTRIRRDLDNIQKHMSGAMSLDVIVESVNGKQVIEPDVIRYADGVMRDLGRKPDILSAHSVTTYLRRMHEVMAGEKDALPESRPLIAQYLLLSGSDENGRLVDPFLDSGRTILRITGRTKHVGTKQGVVLQKWLLERLEEDKPEGVKAYLSGIIPVYINMVHILVGGQLRGFGLAFILITVIMILMQRSFKLGLASMIPNLLPVAVTAGGMGLAGVPLNSATAMIASIAIGIAVDDTIHFTTFYRRFRLQGLTTEAAITKVIHRAGPAMVTTSLVIFAGFGVLMLSDFGPLRMFGMLSALTMISAVMGDLIVLPALLSVVDKSKALRPVGDQVASNPPRS